MSASNSPEIVRWRDKVLSSLPPESNVLARNAAITATYARWYRTAPQLLRWAGAAAFASHRVGLALLPYKFVVDDGMITGIAETFDDNRDKSLIFDDLDIIRRTNNEVFADIGWAHHAYLAPDGGVAAIERALRDEESHSILLDGFRAIEAGRRMQDEGSALDQSRAPKVVWDGNLLLLNHEQRVTVQPRFNQLDAGFRNFLSVTTAIDFDADHLRIDRSTHTSFYKFMWTRGIGMLLRTWSLPEIQRFDHRWFWVEKSVFRIWRRVAETDPRLPRKLAILMNQAIV